MKTVSALEVLLTGTLKNEANKQFVERRRLVSKCQRPHHLHSTIAPSLPLALNFIQLQCCLNLSLYMHLALTKTMCQCCS